MSKQHIQAVCAVLATTPPPATIKEGTAAMRATSDHAADVSRRAERFCIHALCDAAESLAAADDDIAAGYTAAANKALRAADAYCTAANDLVALAALYREKTDD